MNLGANWTWSHCIGLAATNISNLEAVYPHQPYQNNGPQDRHLDMGDCTGNVIDIRHVVNLTAVFNTPNFSGTWAHRLGTGWNISTIYTWRTGPPVTPQLNPSSDNALNGFAPSGADPVPQRPNQVLPDVYATNQGQSCSPAPCVSYLNPNAVATPALGTYGNMGVSSVRAPGFWEWDQAITRQFPIRETMRLEFRAEGVQPDELRPVRRTQRNAERHIWANHERSGHHGRGHRRQRRHGRTNHSVRAQVHVLSYRP